MTTKDWNLLAVGLILALIGYGLLKQPNCNRGCRTIAEHILNHGLGDIFAALG